MADKCKKCGKEIGLFSTMEIDGENFCIECSKKINADKNIYIPEIDAIKRALSGLLTQDSDTKKLFEEGSRTYIKIFGGDINNFINLNSNLIQASLLFNIFSELKNLKDNNIYEKKVDKSVEINELILQNIMMMNKKNDLLIKKLEDIDEKEGLILQNIMLIKQAISFSLKENNL